MLKYIEVTAKTEEEAIAKGLAQLGLDRDDVSLEILERGKTGFLGIGSVPAKVKLTYEAPDEPPRPRRKNPRPAQSAALLPPRRQTGPPLSPQRENQSPRLNRRTTTWLPPL